VKFPVNWVDDLNNEYKPKLHLKVLEAKQVPVGENDVGEISSASLLVSARLWPALLVVYTPKPGALNPKADLVIDNVWLNPLPDSFATLYSIDMEIRLDSFLPPTTGCKDRYDTSTEMFGREVFCMRVATLSSKEHSIIIWLDPAKITYERIGIVSESIGYSCDRQLGRLPCTN
jgi:hypothetical protein